VLSLRSTLLAPGLVAVRIGLASFAAWQSAERVAGEGPPQRPRRPPREHGAGDALGDRGRRGTPPPGWTDDDRYEVFDEWLHTVNASYSKAVAPKEADIVRLLREHAGLSAQIADQLS
jgi:hypothetical protein